MTHWVIRRDFVQSIIAALDCNGITLGHAKRYFSAYGVTIKGRTKRDFIKNLSALLAAAESPSRSLF